MVFLDANRVIHTLHASKPYNKHMGFICTHFLESYDSVFISTPLDTQSRRLKMHI